MAVARTWQDFIKLDLSEWRLQDADLTGCVLSYTSFRNTVLTGTRFVLADLDGVDFTGADIADVDLTGAWVDEVQWGGNRQPTRFPTFSERREDWQRFHKLVRAFASDSRPAADLVAEVESIGWPALLEPLAYFFLLQGDDDSGMALMRRVVAESASVPPFAARILSARVDAALAVELLRRVPEGDPSVDTALGTVLAVIGDDAGATVCLDRAIEADLPLAAPWFERGRIQIRQGDPGAARPLLEKALVLAPSDPRIRWILADLLTDPFDERPAAIRILEPVLNQPGLVPEERVSVASLFTRLGRPSDAITLLDAIPADQTPAGAHVWRAEALAAQGRVMEANALLEGMDPEAAEPVPPLLRSRLAWLQDRVDEAQAAAAELPPSCSAADWLHDIGSSDMARAMLTALPSTLPVLRRRLAMSRSARAPSIAKLERQVKACAGGSEIADWILAESTWPPALRGAALHTWGQGAPITDGVYHIFEQKDPVPFTVSSPSWLLWPDMAVALGHDAVGDIVLIRSSWPRRGQATGEWEPLGISPDAVQAWRPTDGSALAPPDPGASDTLLTDLLAKEEPNELHTVLRASIEIDLWEQFWPEEDELRSRVPDLVRALANIYGLTDDLLGRQPQAAIVDGHGPPLLVKAGERHLVLPELPPVTTGPQAWTRAWRAAWGLTDWEVLRRENRLVMRPMEGKVTRAFEGLIMLQLVRLAANLRRWNRNVDPCTLERLMDLLQEGIRPLSRL